MFWPPFPLKDHPSVTPFALHAVDAKATELVWLNVYYIVEFPSKQRYKIYSHIFFRINDNDQGIFAFISQRSLSFQALKNNWFILL